MSPINLNPKRSELPQVEPLDARMRVDHGDEWAKKHMIRKSTVTQIHNESVEQ